MAAESPVEVKETPLPRILSITPSLELEKSKTSIVSFKKTTGAEKSTKGLKYANSYVLDSKFPFNPEKVENICKAVILRELTDLVYDADACSQLCQDMSLEICHNVKELRFDRYKILCVVDIIERRLQGIKMVSKFLWDIERDCFANFFFENTTLFAAAQVFGLYFE